MAIIFFSTLKSLVILQQKYDFVFVKKTKTKNNWENQFDRWIGPVQFQWRSQFQQSLIISCCQFDLSILRAYPPKGSHLSKFRVGSAHRKLLMKIIITRKPHSLTNMKVRDAKGCQHDQPFCSSFKNSRFSKSLFSFLFLYSSIYHRFFSVCRLPIPLPPLLVR